MESQQLTSEPTWYARKPYIHFDLPLGLDTATAYVSDPANVVRHAFYPLLTYQLKVPRIEKRPPGSSRPFIKQYKPRDIAYAAHKDGYIFSYYKSILEDRYEDWIRSNNLVEAVTAFRSMGENNITLAKKAFDFIQSQPDCQIIVADVESFFPSLDHKILKRTWADFLGVEDLPRDHYAVYKAITRYSMVERHKAYNTFRIRITGRLKRDKGPRRICTPDEFRDKIVGRGLIRRGPSGKGVPQGVSLSPLLSNMYMAHLDLTMNDLVTSLGGKYWRYCDDVLIVVPSDNQIDLTQQFDSQLKSLSLDLNKDKTRKLVSEQLRSCRQLQYLGFAFNGSEAVVRPSAIHRYVRKLRKSVEVTTGRQKREAIARSSPAPFRKQALYNMYSDKPVRGRRIQDRIQQREFRGGFIQYLDRAANIMNSSRIRRQRRTVLGRFENGIP